MVARLIQEEFAGPWRAARSLREDRTKPLCHKCDGWNYAGTTTVVRDFLQDLTCHVPNLAAEMSLKEAGGRQNGRATHTFRTCSEKAPFRALKSVTRSGMIMSWSNPILSLQWSSPHVHVYKEKHGKPPHLNGKQALELNPTYEDEQFHPVVGQNHSAGLRVAILKARWHEI